MSSILTVTNDMPVSSLDEESIVRNLTLVQITAPTLLCWRTRSILEELFHDHSLGDGTMSLLARSAEVVWRETVGGLPSK